MITNTSDEANIIAGGETMKRIFGLLASAIAIAAQSAPAQAQGEAAFYAGKTVSLVIGSGEAGVYDLGGRLMARYLKKYIPGAPTIVPRNMPGASSVVAAEYVYNVAPRDGLTISTVQPTVVLNKVLEPAAKYESGRFTWIGRLQPVVLVGIAWAQSGVSGVADARARAVIVSASGATGTSAIVPWALNQVAGTKFQVIRGYESQRPQFLAMERGEVNGVGSASLSDVLENQDWAANGRIRYLYTIAQKRSHLLPDTPAITELATDEKDRQVLALLGSVTDIGQTLMAPPGLPRERLATLSAAFDAMARDPELIQEAQKLGIIVDPLSAAQLSTLVNGVSDAPADQVEKLRFITRPQ